MKKTETEYGNFNEEIVNGAKKQMLSELYVSRLSSFFKVIGDETRVKILHALSLQEMCVNDIAVTLEMSQSAVSHQLRQLKTEGLVRSRREGKNIYYLLDDDHVVGIFNAALTHVKHKLTEYQEI